MSALKNARAMFCVDGMSVKEFKLDTGVIMVVCDTNPLDWMVITFLFDRDGNLLETKYA